MFFGREVDDTVRDDHIDAVIGNRQVLDFAKAEFDVGKAVLVGIVSSFPEHFMRHIDTDDAPRLAHGARGQKTVEAGAAAQI
jgi:hypothetical protein